MIHVLDPNKSEDLHHFYSLGTKIRSKHTFNAIDWNDDQNIDQFAKLPNCQIRLFGIETDNGSGRVAALQFDNRQEGMIGWYECSSDIAISNQLLEAATTFLTTAGCTSVMGPINGNTWNSYRFNKTSEKPIMPGDPYQPLYYIEFWEAFGFSSTYNYQSNSAPLDLFEPMTMDEGRELAQQFNLKVDYYPAAPSKEFMDTMYSFYHACFEDNPLFKAIDKEGYYSLSDKLFKIFNPKHSLLVCDRDDNPIAVTLSYRDIYHEAYQAGKIADPEYKSNKLLIKTIATHPEWQGKQIGTLMVNLVNNLANQSGYDEIYHLLMYNDNLSATKGKEKFVTKCVREYALYELKLSQ